MARKIPKNYLSVTGSFASQKNDQMAGFESILEKEFLLLLDFDETVERFEVQEVTIPVPGVPKGYTPDVLIYYKPNPLTGEIPVPVLTEVKHTDDLERNREKYKSKFALADEYARKHGWEFRITTQVDIRTKRLQNIKFLREYRNIQPDGSDRHQLISIATSYNGEFRLKDILQRLAPNDDAQLHWLPVIWHAILKKDLIADWNQLIDYQTLLRLSPGA
ncbi:TnsA endonuclease N-terminal domain-containing protein [Undibacterium sp. Ji49W]|uniref:TnsA endonuclease N-terminal domain-containing protein n=1 Tax=Undibacterium sp. Ji49W TaxID=3413040 RepID=UPI003BF1961F